MEEFIGLDVSKEETSFCVVDKAGKVLSSGKTFSNPEALFCTLKEKTLCPGRIVLETGTLFSNRSGISITALMDTIIGRNGFRRVLIKPAIVWHPKIQRLCCLWFLTVFTFFGTR